MEENIDGLEGFTTCISIMIIDGACGQSIILDNTVIGYKCHFCPHIAFFFMICLKVVLFSFNLYSMLLVMLTVLLQQIIFSSKILCFCFLK